jgi:hypothetical protein
MWHTKLARATAYEKLAVAHVLRRRPVIAEAFEGGRLSYSAVRSMTRISDPDRDVDVALVHLAEAGTVADLDRAIRFYQLHAQQHSQPAEEMPRARLSRRPNLDGTTTIQITLEDSEAEELWCIIRAFAENPSGEPAVPPPPVDVSAAADSSRASPVEAGDASARADRVGGPFDKRAHAVIDMARTALAHVGSANAVGADRYMIHVIVREGHAELIDGTPLPPSVAERLVCESASLLHLVREDGEPLALGRKTKQWNRAQRRAILVRDGGRCRFPGCDYRVTDVHHHKWWNRGGNTDVANGWLACSRHHTLVHEGTFTVTGDPNRILTFLRPDGTAIGTTRPIGAVLVVAA